MAWRVAKSIFKMRDQFNAACPRRNRSSDGFIGDAAHASRSSDHNPWVKDGKTGIVTAGDFTHDPINGMHTWDIAEYLRQMRDPRIKYVISNRRIFSSVQNPWIWRKYTGSNPHSSHMHVSVHSTKNHYDSEAAWKLFPSQPSIPSDPDSPDRRPVLRMGSTGEFVQEVQNILGIAVDGVFGKITDESVRKFQRMSKVREDGIVGPVTWALLDRIEQRGDGEHDGDAFE
jgi:peptidoglycan hydrolase-like protein with peptidoglycan-binding domain